jgi:hypothetical protein
MNREVAPDVVSAEMDPEAGASEAARLGYSSRGWQGRRRMVEIAVFATLIVGAIFAMPGLGELRDRLGGADPGMMLLVAAVDLGNVLAFVGEFRGVL